MGVAFPLAMVWWATPRVFHFADRGVARRRLQQVSPRVADGAQPHRPSQSRPASDTDGLVTLSSMCDAAARILKSGRSTHEAFIEAIDRVAPDGNHWPNVRSALMSGVGVRDALRDSLTFMNPDSDESLCAELLLAAMVGPSPVVSGVEHAATVLRDVASTRADLRVATAQARLSARILTVLPLVVLAGGFLTNSGFRSSVLDASVFLPLVAGLILNRVGWIWISRLLEAVVSGARRFELAEIVDRLCVSLMAGCTLAQACEALGDSAADDVDSAGRLISVRVREGSALSTCLEPLGSSFGLQGRLFADVLVGADRDGLPIVGTVARIAQDVRIERRRRVDTAIRQIPVKLTIPLVVCVLPGFLLTTLVPLVASSVGALTVSLPGVLAPFGS